MSTLRFRFYLKMLNYKKILSQLELFSIHPFVAVVVLVVVVAFIRNSVASV